MRPDALRDIMCRLSSQRFTPGSLSSALGMPEGQVLRRIKTLQGWGLVRMVRRDSATTIVEPLPGDGAGTLRRWAIKYCPMGDECGRPAQGSEGGQDNAYNVRVAGMDMALLGVGDKLGTTRRTMPRHAKRWWRISRMRCRPTLFTLAGKLWAPRARRVLGGSSA